jgi:hypothetical protein
VPFPSGIGVVVEYGAAHATETTADLDGNFDLIGHGSGDEDIAYSVTVGFDIPLANTIVPVTIDPYCGAWNVRESYTETCGRDTTSGNKSFRLSVDAPDSDGRYLVHTPLVNVSATVSNGNLRWDATFPEEGGTTDQTFTGQITPDTFDASSTWTWTQRSTACTGSATYFGERECVGCACSMDSECDDRRECTRDTCVNGRCRIVPDNSILPKPRPNDCVSCDNGVVKSAKAVVEKECSAGRQNALHSCSQHGTADWFVHWVAKEPAGIQQFAYCEQGVDAAEAELSVCAGSGTCKAGSPVRIETEDMARETAKQCATSTGTEVYACSVVCSYCVTP